MMKYLFSLALLIVLASCGGGTDVNTEEKPKDNFSVDGKIDGAEGMSLYLEALSQQGTIEVAKTTISANGSFSMKGNVPGLGIYQLRLGESSDKMISSPAWARRVTADKAAIPLVKAKAR